ncbi:MAG: hypothetical protein KJ737_19490 [Proteobacteria bacterium]|nr:hypothetical protein [Pseudomonadota bacterium]
MEKDKINSQLHKIAVIASAIDDAMPLERDDSSAEDILDVIGMIEAAIMILKPGFHAELSLRLMRCQ